MSLLFSLLLSSAPSAAPSTVQAPAKVELITADDGVRRLVAARKGKVVVVKFWATWCDPCIKHFPEFVRVAKKFPERDVEVLTISVDLKQGIDKEVLPFLRQQSATFPAYLLDVEDPTPVMQSIDKDWSGTLPATFVYDRAGALKKRMIGATPALEATVNDLLKP